METLNLGHRLVNRINRHTPFNWQILPFRWFGVLVHGDKRSRIRIAIWHDQDWDTHFTKSWRHKGYWFHKETGKNYGRVQIMDLVVEWRVGQKANR